MIEEVDLGDRKVTVIGTAHVSDESVEEVKEVLVEGSVDFVGVELDEERLETLRQKTGWKNLDVAEALRDGKGSILFLNLVLSVYQRKLGLREGVEPGAEMLEAVKVADAEGIDYKCVDRPISETFHRLRTEMGLWEKAKFLTSFLWDPVDYDVEDLKEVSVLNSLVDHLKEEFPVLNRVFLEERNSYMAEELLEEDFKHAAIVVGAAHVEGLVEELRKEERTEISISTGSRIPWFKIIHYGAPTVIIAMLGYSFLKIGFGTGVKASSFWILSNGILAMLGAILARSHILTWIISFISAPLTSLDPALGAGMVASYFEARFYPPKVEELEEIAYIESYRELWSNQVGRILLTFIFVTIGSAIATFTSAGYIASIIAGL